MRWKSLFAVAMTASLGCAAAASASFASPWIYNPDTGHYYAVLNQSTWQSANAQGLYLGAPLTTVETAAENAWLLSTFGTYGGRQRILWIGLSDAASEGNFVWSSGSTSAYRNWASGQPDGGTGENYVAIYYPAHSQGGKWNDWGTRSSDPIGIDMCGVLESAQVPSYQQFETNPANTKVIAPLGDQTGAQLSAVGIAWEHSHPGWNGSAPFDDSAWSAATQVSGASIWGSAADAPIYGRMTITLADVPLQYAFLEGYVDDDAILYVNGILAYAGSNGGAHDYGTIDVASMLHPGDNVIAFKAQNLGGGYHFRADVTLAYIPEPAGATTAILAATLLTRRQRRNAPAPK